MDTMAPICGACARTDDMETCEAFPEGIPQSILENKVDHRQPIKGDSGLRFVQDTTKPDLPHDVFDTLVFGEEQT